MTEWTTNLASGVALIAALTMVIRGISVALSARWVKSAQALSIRRWIVFGRAFRWIVCGLGLAGVVIGLLIGSKIVVGLTLVIALEELYESTMMVGVLGHIGRAYERGSH